MGYLHICETEWRSCKKIVKFLEAEAAVTECSGGQNYIMRSAMDRIYTNLIRK